MSKHPIYDEFWRQRSDLVEADKTPRTVVFSDAGWSKALAEADKVMGGGSHVTYGPSGTYGGLHRCVDNRPGELPEVVVTELTQAEYFAPRSRGNMSVKLSVDMADARQTIAEIIGSKLSKPQLCDLIISFVESHHPDEKDPFAIELKAVVERHGRFE